jgi:hypothetical protein
LVHFSKILRSMVTLSAGRAALPAWEAWSMRVECSEIVDMLRVGRKERSGALGLRCIDPDSVDLLLRRSGDILRSSFVSVRGWDMVIV